MRECRNPCIQSKWGNVREQEWLSIREPRFFVTGEWQRNFLEFEASTTFRELRGHRLSVHRSRQYPAQYDAIWKGNDGSRLLSHAAPRTQDVHVAAFGFYHSGAALVRTGQQQTDLHAAE